MIEPLTCGYLDPIKSDEYKTNKVAYISRRNSIIDADNAISNVILETVARWAATLLGSPEQVFLMNEQYIIKPPHSVNTSQFAWHQVQK